VNKQQRVRPTKYDIISGPEGPVLPFEVAASVNFELLSGKWMTLDTNNRADISSATDTAILGWALVGDWTTSSTAGRDVISVNINHDIIGEMPLDAARTEAQLKGYIGETCDIVVTSNIQYADYDASSIDILEIMGYRYYGSASGEQTLLCRVYLANLTTKGGVA
jgi:hypothetical protein